MILHGGFDNALLACVLTSKSNAPWYTNPVSPSAQETVTISPSRSKSVAFTEPTIAGIPNSRAIIAAWQVRPPRLVTKAAARFITGSQFGSVMSATNTSPGCTSCICAGSNTMRTGPTPTFCVTARPATNGLAECFCSLYDSVTLFNSSCDLTVSGRACKIYSLLSKPFLPHSISIGQP